MPMLQLLHVCTYICMNTCIMHVSFMFTFWFICLFCVAPFVNVLNNNNAQSNDESSDDTSAAIIIPSIIGGILLLTFIIIFFTVCNGAKKTKNFFEQFYECCCEGCLSFLRLLDIRRYFRHRERYLHFVCMLLNLS